MPTTCCAGRSRMKPAEKGGPPHRRDEEALLSGLMLTSCVSAGFRLETLQSENGITQEKFDEVARGWSEALEVVIPQDLETAINHQKGLCRVIIEDKERLVAELQNVKLLC